MAVLTLAALLVLGALAGIIRETPAQGFSPMRSITGSLSRPVLHSVRTVIRPTLGIARDRAGAVVQLSQSVDNRFVLSVLADRTARIWDLEGGRQLGEVFAKGIVAGAFHPADDGSRGSGPQIVALLADGSLVAAHPDGAVRQMGPRIERLDPDTATVMSADSSTVAYRTVDGGWQWTVWRDGLTRPLPDAARDARPVLSRTGQSVAWRTARGSWAVLGARSGGRDVPVLLEGCTESIDVTAATFVPDASRLVLGDGSGSLCVWHLSGPRFRLLFAARALRGPVRAVALDRQGIRAAVAGADSEMVLWSLETGTRVASWEPGATPSALLLDSARRWVLAGGDAGTIGVWSAEGKTGLGRLISLRRGWGVVDRRGRFDVSRNGFDSLVWAAQEQTLPIGAFSESYFEPGLLAKLDEAAPFYLNAEVRDIAADGYVAPPGVALAPLSLRELDDRGRLTVTVRFEGRSRDSGITLRLYHNGKLVPASSADFGSGVARYRVTLLPGENEFEAVGVNPDGIEGRPAATSINLPERVPRASALHVVAVGIDEYGYPAWKLDYSRNDAETLAHTLYEEGRGLFGEVNATPLLDASASVFDIEHNLRRAVASGHDVLVVYLAGHGFAFQEGGEWEWYFLPFTNAWRAAGRQGEKIGDLIRQHGLSSRRLMDVLAEAGPRRVFLILDSCYSGAAVEALSASRSAEVNDAVAQKSLHRLGRVGGIHVLAATRANEEAVELLLEPHGALTYLVLEGLRGRGADGNLDGKVSVRELIDYAAREMPLLSQRLPDRQRIGQKPVGYSRGEDFALAGE